MQVITLESQEHFDVFYKTAVSLLHRRELRSITPSVDVIDGKRSVDVESLDGEVKTYQLFL